MKRTVEWHTESYYPQGTRWRNQEYVDWRKRKGDQRLDWKRYFYGCGKITRQTGYSHFWFKIFGFFKADRWRFPVQNPARRPELWWWLGSTSCSQRVSTVQRSTKAITLSLAVSIPNSSRYTQDITRSYEQLCTALEWKVFLCSSAKINVAPDAVLMVRKALYGIPESGLHWYLTYTENQVNTIDMV